MENKLDLNKGFAKNNKYKNFVKYLIIDLFA